MADVFISYHEASAGELVAQIAAALESAGISCWYAKRDIPPGGDFLYYINQQIDACKVFLLILNDNAVYQSRHIENEVGLAFRRLNSRENITILPLEIGNFKRKMWAEYYLIHIQSVKIPALDEPHIQRLIRQISSLLGSQRSLSKEPLLKVSLQKKTHDVFISYHNSALKLVERICAALEDEKIFCWYAPRNETPGIHYMSAIMQAIRECRIFLLILNQGANKSPAVLREVHAAYEQEEAGTIILPFHTEKIDLRDEFKFILGPLHSFESQSSPTESDIRKLVDYIAGALGRD